MCVSVASPAGFVNGRHFITRWEVDLFGFFHDTRAGPMFFFPFKSLHVFLPSHSLFKINN